MLEMLRRSLSLPCQEKVNLNPCWGEKYNYQRRKIFRTGDSRGGEYLQKKIPSRENTCHKTGVPLLIGHGKTAYLMRQEKEKGKTSLRKRMIFYFLLIAIANVFVAGEFVWEIKSDSYRAEVVQEINKIKQNEKPVEHAYVILDRLARKFVIMILILIIVSAVVLFLFVIQIASPIQYMINMADKMSDGDLSLRIEIRSQDEIAVLGKLINDLSINIQELVAQLERMAYEFEEAVEMHDENLKNFPNIRSYFEEETARLNKILKEFRLLKDMYVLFTLQTMVENIQDSEKK